MLRAATVASIFLLSGCTTGGGQNVRWWSPGTWFSGSSAVAADKATTKEEAARHEVVKAAQRTAHQTQLALAEAPPSRPVAAATDFNASTVALLDQAEGPLTAGESAKLRATVAGLLSENAEIRAKAERQVAAERETIAGLSARLAKAEIASEAAGKALRAAFDRENALANELRNQRALFWIAAGVALLCAVGWLYVNVALGGFRAAVKGGLGALRAKGAIPANPDEPNVFDTFLNRAEQAALRKINP